MLRRSSGFTLIEVLVVMVLIGVMVSLVHLTAGDSPARQARDEAGTLIQVLQALREQAVLEGREFGVHIEERGYRVMALKVSDWQPVGPRHVLVDGLSLRLELEGQPLTLGSRRDQPQVLVLSSDETSVFRLHFETLGQRWFSLSSDGLGEPLIEAR